MPAEWAPHERTLMAWPCRKELWGSTIEQARRDHATVIDAIAAFEPVTLVVHPSDVADATAAVTDRVEVVERPIDDSWMRDTGPIYVVDESGLRTGVHFRFNGWGGSFTPYDGDEETGRWLVEHLGDPIVEVPLVLEGGSIAVDGHGVLAHDRGVPAAPEPQPRPLARGDRGVAHRASGRRARRVAGRRGSWRTATPTATSTSSRRSAQPGRVLLQTVPEGNPNFERCEENRRRAQDAGLEVVPVEQLSYVEVAGEEVAVSYLNHYVCNGAVIVPVAGTRARRARAGDDRRRLPGPRDRAGPRGRPRLRRWRPALRHAAGARAGARLGDRR